MVTGSGLRGVMAAGMMMWAPVGGGHPMDAGMVTIPALSPTDDLAQETRVATIGYRLARGAAARCASPENMTGIILHDIGGYAQSDRTAIAKALGWTGGFGVRAVVANSAGERAGVRDGDEIVALDDIDLIRFATDAIGPAASFDRTERFTNLLARRLRSGAVRLTVRRNEMVRDVSLTGDPGCATRFALSPDRRVKAYSDGAYVAVTSGMLALAQDDAALAFAMAHEMAHVLLGHVAERQQRQRPSRATMRMQELSSDRLGLAILHDAGYPPEAALTLLTAVGGIGWQLLDRDHPPIRQRLALIRTYLAMPSDGK